MQTYIVYISALLISAILAYVAEKKGKRKYILFAAIVLSALAGLRAVSVGIDSINYSNYFSMIANGQGHLAYGLEDTFVFICEVLLKIWNNDNFLFTVFALITNLLIFARLWDFKSQISLPVAVAVYYVMFYFMSLNIMRQFAAVAIVFFATRYIAKRNYFKFCLGVIIATLFHISAVFGILFIFCDFFVWKYLSKWQKRLFVCALVVAPFVLIAGLYIIFTNYGYYLANIEIKFGFMIAVKLLLLGAMVLMGRKRGSEDDDAETAREDGYKISSARLYYFLGLIITAGGYMVKYFDRIGLYFYMFEIVCIAMIFKTVRVPRWIKFFILAIYVYTFVLALTSNGQGQLPYLFAWQQS